MITYHRDTEHIGVKNRYWENFRVVPTTDVHRIARGMLRHVWSPVVFKNGRRNEESFISSLWCVLDFDDGLMSLEQAVNNVFADCIRIIGTTKSHQKDKGGLVVDRFRVFLRFDRTITDLAEYRATMTHYIDRHGADPACKDGARFFWPCSEIVDIAHEGYTQEVFPPKIQEHCDIPTRYRASGMVRRRTIEALKETLPQGERNNHCFMIAKDLYEAGFSFHEIYTAIVRSPTYGGLVDAGLGLEITACIRNGIKSIAEGKAYGRRQGPDERAEKKVQRGQVVPIGAGVSDRSKDEPGAFGAEEVAGVSKAVLPAGGHSRAEDRARGDDR